MSKTLTYKLVLLGDAGVGKTALAVQFVKGQFSEFTESTIGASFMNRQVTLPNNTIVKFQIWDTAGQERFHSLAPMYYRGAQAAVVVYDLTNRSSLDKAIEWVRELHQQGDPDVVVALVGNKKDLSVERQITNEGKNYADENGISIYCETSAKTADGVTDLFTHIAKQLPQTSKKDEPLQKKESKIQPSLDQKKDKSGGCCG